MARGDRRMGGQRDPSFQLALGVVGQEAVRVVDDAAEARRRDVGQRGFDRRLGPASAAGVVEPAVDDAAEARRQRARRWLRAGARWPPGRWRSASRGSSSVPCAARTSATSGPCQPSSRGAARGRARPTGRPARRRRAPAARPSAPARGAAPVNCAHRLARQRVRERRVGRVHRRHPHGLVGGQRRAAPRRAAAAGTRRRRARASRRRVGRRPARRAAARPGAR